MRAAPRMARWSPVRLPQRPGFLMRMVRDPDLALASFLIVAAVASAGLIAAA